jgi:hypothetical protein
VASTRYTVVIRDIGGQLRKVLRFVIGPDGSYYMTCPYHESGRVALAKRTVNFASPEKYAASPPVEVGLVEDDEHRVKLTHHPDGWVQFSGKGIVSGRNEDGSAKGLGIQTWPLDRPTAGPACGLTVLNVSAFESVPSVPKDAVVFDTADMLIAPHDTGFVVEGFYFHAMWRRFVERSPNGLVLPYSHPSGAVLNLRVLPGTDSLTGFLGVTAYPAPIKFGDAPSGFAFSSPTGNLRYEEEDLLEAEALLAVYPPVVVSQIDGVPLQLAFIPRDDPPYKKGGPGPSDLKARIQKAYNERVFDRDG